MVHARCKFSLLLNAERAMPQSIKNAEAKFRRPVLATLVVSLVTSWVSSRKSPMPFLPQVDTAAFYRTPSH
jgi:hypothetical protein